MLVTEERPPGIPNATFLPSISIVAPASLACVNLHPDRARVSIHSTCKKVTQGYRPCHDVSVRDGVRTDVEHTPFFTDRLRETNHCCLGRGVVRLAHVPVQTARRGDVDDGAVLGVTLRTRAESQHVNMQAADAWEQKTWAARSRTRTLIRR